MRMALVHPDDVAKMKELNHVRKIWYDETPDIPIQGSPSSQIQHTGAIGLTLIGH